jgi:hypothetical protein
MKRVIAWACVGAVSLILAVPLRAQLAVFDPANYIEAILQVEQLIKQYEFLLKQARRVPVDIASRYHAHSLDWTLHDLTGGPTYADQLLKALNDGDVSGQAYRGVVDPLDAATDVLGRMPVALQKRLTDAYAAIQLQDSMTRLAVNQAGAARTDGPATLQAVKNVEHDIANTDDDFHSQTALLEKINAAFAIGLRIEEQTNQFEVTTLEQLLIDNTRKRDAEARLVNATIYQWRYGQSYGADLYGQTAARIDQWKPF